MDRMLTRLADAVARLATHHGSNPPAYVRRLIAPSTHAFVKLFDNTAFVKLVENTAFVKLLEDAAFVKLFEDTAFVKLFEGTAFVKLIENNAFAKLIEDTAFVKLIDKLSTQTADLGCRPDDVEAADNLDPHGSPKLSTQAFVVLFCQRHFVFP